MRPLAHPSTAICVTAARRLVACVALLAALALPEADVLGGSGRTAGAQESVNALPAHSSWLGLPNGAFFVTGEDALGLTGYAVLDEPGGAPWWTSFALLGGADALGAPLSRPFALPDAHSYQAFEYGVLRWRAGLSLAQLAEALDLMWAAGRDEWLVSGGVPAMAAGPEHTELKRVGWLTHEPLRDAYFSVTHPLAEPGLPAALLRFGLPASPPVADESGVVQRFDRAALRWDAASDAITTLQIGLLLAQSGLLDDRALAPDRLVGGLLIARAPRPLLTWPNSRGWGVADVAPSATDPTSQRPTEGQAQVAEPSPTPPPSPSATLAAPLASPIAPTSTAPASQRSAATPSPATAQTPHPSPTGAPAAAGAMLTIKGVVNEGRAEHVVLANDGTAPQEMTGWALRSGTGGQVLPFPTGFVLQPGAAVRIHSGSGASSENHPPTDLFATSQNVWNNQGDSALLVDATGRVVSQLTYGG